MSKYTSETGCPDCDAEECCLVGTETYCRHAVLRDPDPGKHLRVCRKCHVRVIRCDVCDKRVHAGPDFRERCPGWRRWGSGELRGSLCPDCEII